MQCILACAFDSSVQQILDHAAQRARATSRVMVSNLDDIVALSGHTTTKAKKAPNLRSSAVTVGLLLQPPPCHAIKSQRQRQPRQLADTHVAKMMTRRRAAMRLNLSRHDLTCGRRHSLRQLPLPSPPSLPATSPPAPPLPLQFALGSGKVF